MGAALSIYGRVAKYPRGISLPRYPITEAVSKAPFSVDAIVPIASEQEIHFHFDAMETIASTGCATAACHEASRSMWMETIAFTGCATTA